MQKNSKYAQSYQANSSFLFVNVPRQVAYSLKTTVDSTFLFRSFCFHPIEVGKKTIRKWSNLMWMSYDT